MSNPLLDFFKGMTNEDEDHWGMLSRFKDNYVKDKEQFEGLPYEQQMGEMGNARRAGNIMSGDVGDIKDNLGMGVLDIFAQFPNNVRKSFGMEEHPALIPSGGIHSVGQGMNKLTDKWGDRHDAGISNQNRLLDGFQAGMDNHPGDIGPDTRYSADMTMETRDRYNKEDRMGGALLDFYKGTGDEETQYMTALVRIGQSQPELYKRIMDMPLKERKQFMRIIGKAEYDYQ